MSDFDADLEVGEVIEAYLLEHLFSEIATEPTPLRSLDAQHNEGDIRATIPDVGEDIIIDVKSQNKYINEPRPTFALEVGYFKYGSHRPGWLFDDSKAATHYLFCWVPEATSKTPKRTDQIERLQCLLINRSLLRQYLETEGFGQEAAEANERAAREAGESGPLESDHHSCYYFLSTGYAEEPFNIIVKYPLLEILAEETYEINHGVVRSGVELF